MIKHYLLSPGPTPIPNEVALAMAETMIHHRTPQFNRVFDEAREKLKKLFGTKNDVLILASSGTGAMEAAVANLFSPGDKVLVVNGGKFGERWLNISNAYGLSPIDLRVPWGQAVKVAEVEKALKANPDIQGVMIQASETSTTVLHPVREIAKLTKNGPLFLVDGVTAVGVVPLLLDDWGIDALVTGSQKALMLPPGLGFVALSDRAWEKTKKAKLPRFYFDLNLERKNQQKGSGAFTPAVSLIFGVRASLNMIEREGVENVYARHARLCRATRAAATALGLKLLAPDSPSPAATGVYLPDRHRRGSGARLSARQDERHLGRRPGSAQRQSDPHCPYRLYGRVRRDHRGRRIGNGAQKIRRRNSARQRRRRGAGSFAGGVGVKAEDREWRMENRRSRVICYPPSSILDLRPVSKLWTVK